MRAERKASQLCPTTGAEGAQHLSASLVRFGEPSANQIRTRVTIGCEDDNLHILPWSLMIPRTFYVVGRPIFYSFKALAREDMFKIIYS